MLDNEAPNRPIALFQVEPQLLVDELVHEPILDLHSVGVRTGIQKFQGNFDIARLSRLHPVAA